jgi:hypothetical protein
MRFKIFSTEAGSALEARDTSDMIKGAYMVFIDFLDSKTLFTLLYIESTLFFWIIALPPTVLILAKALIAALMASIASECSATL